MSNFAQPRRQQHVRPQETEWLLVSERNRCPICDATSSCHRDLEGAFACCARRTSDWPLTSGAWLHRISGNEGAHHGVVTHVVEAANLGARSESLVHHASFTGSTH